MSRLIYLIPPIVSILFLVVIISFARIADRREDRTIRYDCSIAEISPDFPVEVKNACRKKLSGRI
jgi:hypothetical protein